MAMYDDTGSCPFVIQNGIKIYYLNESINKKKEKGLFNFILKIFKKQ